MLIFNLDFQVQVHFFIDLKLKATTLNDLLVHGFFRRYDVLEFGQEGAALGGGF